MIQVFIGYDAGESVAYHVAAHSILRRSSAPVTIAPVALTQLKTIYHRERGPTESTEFSLTRFLVPYLSGYQGYSIYMDCDFLCLTDITDLLDHCNLEVPISVCQHDYTPKSATKMRGQVQTTYPRKNWSSLMVFNNQACRVLTPSYVNHTEGLELQRFLWAEDRIGSLPLEWNWLVGEYPINFNAKMLHYTLGGPWFSQTRECDHAQDWLDEYRHLTGSDYYPVQTRRR